MIYDLSNLSMSDIIRCGIDIRALGNKSKSMEAAAIELVQYVFNNFIDKETGQKSCALVRFFKTHDMDKLPQQLQDFANNLLQEKLATASFKCYTLLATCLLYTSSKAQLTTFFSRHG